MIDLAGAADHAIDEFACRRGHVERADIHHAGAADDEAARRGEVDIAADLPVLVGIHHAVDHGRVVAVDQIDQVAGAVRQNEVAGIAGADLELRKRVEGVRTADRGRGDRADAAVRSDRGRGAAIGNDIRDAGRNALGKGQRRINNHDNAEQRRAHAQRHAIDKTAVVRPKP